MSSRTAVRLLVVGGPLALAAIAACSSNGSNSAASSSASHNDAGTSGSSSTSDGSTAVSDAGHDGGDAAPTAAGLLIDDMSAEGTRQIALAPPAGATRGTFYGYSDPNSSIPADSQLADAKLSSSITNTDGTTLTDELCLAGTVYQYAGLGMSFAYKMKPADAAPNDSSPAVPFDASKYSGVSFYIFVSPSDGGMLPSFHFGIPDTQTADPQAWPQTACATIDATGQQCDDDFGTDLTFETGKWVKMSFLWADLAQQTWGAQFTALKTDQLIGMKWQANGGDPDAAAEPFSFCLSNVYFTP